MNNNITWHNGLVTHDDRRRITGQKPAVIWFTGLSGSGKSAVAAELEALLTAAGYAAYLLDGDNLRWGLNSGLGFSEEDRRENVRRIAEAARLLADSGQIAIVSAISPLRSMRDAARSRISEICDFIEIFVDTPLEVCVERDVKGLYRRAMAGEIKDFTGISSPYEPPADPEITITDTVSRSAADNAVPIYDYIIASQTDLKAMLGVMSDTATEAGRLIMNIYSDRFDVDIKADNSPLTDADRASNAYICSILAERYPYVSLLAEESADDRRRLQNRMCFIIDPLDGTKEFISRNGEFTVNIALVRDHIAIIGVIYVPVTGELYTAVRGGGAFRTKDGVRESIRVSDRTENLILMASRSHGDSRLDRIIEANRSRVASVVNAGSSLKGCRVAEGRADVYYRYGPTMEWDTAAMQCICEEAGAVVRQLDGYDSPLYYNRTHTRNDMGFYILNKPENKLDPKR
ncbi:MAG: 3'(2'),5'-bisphosphate nucleotidase CysQ [Eubacteriales bacterium]|nr:3'(2'),5'-bisphosphate nucleotidase CysQ [Eubacteriales bacterium]